MSMADYLKGKQDGLRAARDPRFLPYPHPEGDYQRGVNQGVADYEIDQVKEDA